MRALGLVSVLVLAAPAYPCLVFLVTDGRHVLAGNNEDYGDPSTHMWVVPGGNGKHGRVCFGYANGFTQGGVNDAGLFFDGLALDFQAVPRSDKPTFAGHAGDLALADCATVEEVIELFARHDRGCLANAQVLFGDKTGDAVIFEGNAVIRKQGPHLLATNFRQSVVPPSFAGCERYDRASELLEGMSEVTVDGCRSVLSLTHQEGPYPTQYSNVYDLANGKIHLYHFHDFGNAVVLDVAALLAKGAHTVEIASLFPRKCAFTAFQRQIEEDLAARREVERDKTVDPDTFGAFVGRYRVREGAAAGLEFDVRRVGDKLFAEFSDQEPVELAPRGGEAFVCISGAERAELVFSRGKNGPVEGVKLVQRGVEIRAEKLV